jgi:hypothetical protein
VLRLQAEASPPTSPIGWRSVVVPIAAAAMALGLAISAASAREAASTAVLRERFFHAEGYCRGSTDPTERAAGCARREAISKQLEARGQCYARVLVKRTNSMESVWQPCWPPRGDDQ